MKEKLAFLKIVTDKSQAPDLSDDVRGKLAYLAYAKQYGEEDARRVFNKKKTPIVKAVAPSEVTPTQPATETEKSEGRAKRSSPEVPSVPQPRGSSQPSKRSRQSAPKRVPIDEESILANLGVVDEAPENELFIEDELNSQDDNLE